MSVSLVAADALELSQVWWGGEVYLVAWEGCGCLFGYRAEEFW